MNKFLNTTNKRITFLLVFIGALVGLITNGTAGILPGIIYALVVPYLLVMVWFLFLSHLWNWLFTPNKKAVEERRLINQQITQDKSVKQLLLEAWNLAEKQGSTNVAEKIRKILSSHYSYRNPSR